MYCLLSTLNLLSTCWCFSWFSTCCSGMSIWYAFQRHWYGNLWKSLIVSRWMDPDWSQWILMNLDESKMESDGSQCVLMLHNVSYWIQVGPNRSRVEKGGGWFNPPIKGRCGRGINSLRFCIFVSPYHPISMCITLPLRHNIYEKVKFS